MKEISFYLMEHVCSKCTVRVTKEQEEALKQMSRDDAREWFLSLTPDEECYSLHEHVYSDDPHCWDDSTGNRYDLEPFIV